MSERKEETTEAQYQELFSDLYSSHEADPLLLSPGWGSGISLSHSQFVVDRNRQLSPEEQQRLNEEGERWRKIRIAELREAKRTAKHDYQRITNIWLLVLTSLAVSVVLLFGAIILALATDDAQRSIQIVLAAVGAVGTAGTGLATNKIYASSKDARRYLDAKVKAVDEANKQIERSIR